MDTVSDLFKQYYNDYVDKNIKEFDGSSLVTQYNDIKNLVVDIKDNLLDKYLTIVESNKVAIEWIKQEVSDIDLTNVDGVSDIVILVTKYLIKFYWNKDKFTKVGDTITIVLDGIMDISTFLKTFTTKSIELCKDTLDRIYKYIKSQVKIGLETAMNTINNSPFIRTCKDLLSRSINYVWKKYSKVSTRGSFTIEDYVVKVPEYVCVNESLIDTWKSVVNELSKQYA